MYSGTGLPKMLTESPNGITANAMIAGTSTMIGASVNTHLSARTGVMSSLTNSFSTSAIGWSTPCGPTRIGPRRTWTHACTLRSSSTRYMTVTSTAARTMTILMSGR